MITDLPAFAFITLRTFQAGEHGAVFRRRIRKNPPISGLGGDMRLDCPDPERRESFVVIEQGFFGQLRLSGYRES